MGTLKSLRKSIVHQSDDAMSLAKHVISTKADNLVFSPLSIQVLLALIAAGSDGPTRHQLLRYLKANSVQELTSQASQIVTLLFANGAPFGGPRLSFANGVWVDQSLNLKPGYKQIVENDFRSALERVDFKSKAALARQEVNTWAEKKTRGLIQELLPPDSVNSETRLILANAVYFKGTWNQKFNPSLTKDHVFFLLNGSSAKVPFMTSKENQYIKSFKDFKVLSLPYKQVKQGGDKRRFAMHIFLPNAKDGLPALVEKVSSESRFIKDHLPLHYIDVEVGDFRIPKFKINFGFEASEALRGHGLVLPFECVSVEKFYQNTFIEVNEVGTEAASASGSSFLISAPVMLPKNDPPIDFVADHPFLFVVREDMTGAVLFVGKVLNPELQGKGNVNKKRKR